MHTVVMPQHPDAVALTFDTVVKAREVKEALIDAMSNGQLTEVDLVPARSADSLELVRVHTRQYVDAVRNGEPESIASSNGIGWDPHLFEIAAGSAGAIRDAALEAISTQGFVGALSAGLHHARSERGAGYCTFNGLVVAARAALDAGARRVLILDLDAHCGGGTASIISTLVGVEQVDIAVNTFDRYTSDDQSRLITAVPDSYLQTVEQELNRITDPARIDLVIHNAGMDVHEQAGGPRGIDTDMVALREQMVFEWARSHSLPVAWTLAGGYQSSSFSLRDVAQLHLLTPSAAIAAAAR
jgi:acetoin utilization deacetylase AcuC-like enzyme